jgi:putative ATPase
MQARVLRYDTNREEHYNSISALHKAMRGSDPQGSLYWLARMLAAGEDPLYVARRMVRFASEDVGLADPRALTVAIAARDAYHFLGTPEGELALAEAVIYLATAPKSNRAYVAWGEALRLARQHPDLEVPLHIRNAPTGLMKELGYGAGYQYAHNADDAYIPQEYLPDEIRNAVLYEPGQFGFERDIAKRLAWWRELRERGSGAGVTDGLKRRHDSIHPTCRSCGAARRCGRELCIPGARGIRASGCRRQRRSPHRHRRAGWTHRREDFHL